MKKTPILPIKVKEFKLSWENNKPRTSHLSTEELINFIWNVTCDLSDRNYIFLHKLYPILYDIGVAKKRVRNGINSCVTDEQQEIWEELQAIDREELEELYRVVFRKYLEYGKAEYGDIM